MGIGTAWQAIGQRPWRFLASSWPWRSLAYLVSGIAPSAAVAAGLIALIALPSSDVAQFVLPPVVLALLLSGPVVARYERWRLRLMEVGPAPDQRQRAQGGGRRALEVGYGVVCVVALWLIDLAVVAVSLGVPVGLTMVALRSADAGGGSQAAMLAVAVLALPVAAYPLTAWAGARAALAGGRLLLLGALLGSLLLGRELLLPRYLPPGVPALKDARVHRREEQGLRPGGLGLAMTRAVPSVCANGWSTVTPAIRPNRFESCLPVTNGKK